MKFLFWVGALGFLLFRYIGTMWFRTIDTAHHYSLIAQLAEHWRMGTGFDRSLGEMNFYPRGAHLVAAFLSNMLGSNLLATQMTALVAVLLVWVAIVCLIMALPAGKRLVAGGMLMLLLLANRAWGHIELHGYELVNNFFLSQIVAHACAWGVVVVAMMLDRNGRPAWQRNLLLVVAMWIVAYIHLLPVMQLFGVLAVLLVLDLRGKWCRQNVLLSLLWLEVGAGMLYQHPGFQAMKLLSLIDGGLYFRYLVTVPQIAAYASVVALVSAGCLWLWYRWPEDERKAWMAWKYVAASTLTLAGCCLLQAFLLQYGAGSPYAVKKYLFGIHTAFLLELALLAGWFVSRGFRAKTAKMAHGKAAVMLIVAVLLVLPTYEKISVPEAIATERELLELRAQIPVQPGRFTYVLQVGPQPDMDYLYSIGIFKVPRFANGYGMYTGEHWHFSSLIDTLITSQHSELDRYPACRRMVTRRGLVRLDAACVKRQAGRVDTWFSLADDVGDGPCHFQGFADPERTGRWSNENQQAAMHCKVPVVNGKAMTTLLLQGSSLVPGKVQVQQNGQLIKEFVFDASHKQQLLSVPLVPDAKGEVDLQWHLSWSPAPGNEERFGLALETLEFK